MLWSVIEKARQEMEQEIRQTDAVQKVYPVPSDIPKGRKVENTVPRDEVPVPFDRTQEAIKRSFLYHDWRQTLMKEGRQRKRG
jgi:hypothetical protein